LLNQSDLHNPASALSKPVFSTGNSSGYRELQPNFSGQNIKPGYNMALDGAVTSKI
jgi:hypothetical protein